MVRRCTLVLTLAFACFGPTAVAAGDTTTVSGPTGDRLVRVATLTALDAGQPLSFDTVAISGQTIAAHSFNLAEPFIEETGVFVFAESAGGWSNHGASAELTAANGDALGEVAVAGENVFVAAPQIESNGPGVIYVFTRPPGGWSGTLHETAKLVASDGTQGTELGRSMAASGSTVIATGLGGPVYVFSEPPGGWSGTVHESAELTSSDGDPLGPVAISGQTVVAGDTVRPSGQAYQPGAVDVFTEPSGEWTGDLHQDATLVSPDGVANDSFGGSVAVSGSTVVATDNRDATDSKVFVDVFTEPSAGWKGTVRDRAERSTGTNVDLFGPEVAISDNNVAAITVQRGTEDECGCGATIYAFSEPATGWGGTRPMAKSASTGSAVETPYAELAVDGQTVVQGQSVFADSAPPSLPSASVSGLPAGKPMLSFKAQAAAGAPLIERIRVTLPQGLSFAEKNPLAHGVSISGSRGYDVEREHGSLIISLKHPTAGLSVRLTAPAVAETTRLRQQIDTIIEHNKRHRRKTALPLRFSVSITDATGSTPITITNAAG